MATPSEAEQLAAINEGMTYVPFNAALGLRAVEASRDAVTLVLPFKPEVVGNPETGVIHGGAVTALLDAACGLAVILRMDTAMRVATLDLRIDYLKPAIPNKDVRARAECYKLTRQVAFVRATAFQDSLEDAVASAAGTFVLFDDRRSPTAQALKPS